ncbi:MAG: hypothetical protein CXT73_06905 [Methanobacteriota archaeon]|jgi:hypothetical protein|nr:MAG: hypothetical protein CXT73_06905 [Euryarchaeota archaeon]
MSILKAFTGHLIEFVNEIRNVFPNDSHLRTSGVFLEGLVKINPKSIIIGWKECINDLYKDQILKGDLEYFINKDYNADLEGSDNKGKILKTIESFRDKIRNMGDDNKKKSVKYIQNLTKLCNMYFQNNSV